MAHGAGGGAMRGLIEGLLAADPDPIDGVGLGAMDDGAAFRVGDRWLVVTTDAHVVHPIEFPGGDIGRLAVCGTVNDLAVMGATEPLGLSCAIVVEEGFSREVLARVWASLRAACREAGAPLVTGDTKVMGRGEVDGLVMTTSGWGFTDRIVRDAGLRPGDRIVVTGPVGSHGLALLAARQRLELRGALRSDVAPLNALLRPVIPLATAMKDATRGGLASALQEMAAKAGVGVLLDEAALPVTEAARAASELLGIDVVHVANEGVAVIGVAPAQADALLAALRAHPLGRHAAIVGTALPDQVGRVILDTGFGRRLLAELDGDPLPRIC
jgi:hydrogenase expression/formation protein HypE